MDTTPQPQRGRPKWWHVAAVAVLVGVAAGGVWYVRHRGEEKQRTRRPPPATLPADELPRKPITIEMGKVRPPLEYRIVSFHRGRVDKRTVRLAKQLGFNGVQVQIEGSTVDGIKAFAEYDAKEKVVEFCHSLGMAVTMWVHELSDLPPKWVPEWLGEPAVDNAALWKVLDDRYEWVLRDALPTIDGLVLTVVETQVTATDTDVLARLVALLQAKCDKYDKSLIVRTFVWYPDEFASVMAAVGKLPGDAVIMSKHVPQDWQMRGTFAAEIGQVGGRPQIVEYDAAGEYFLTDRVANCMPDLLKKHFDHGLKHNVKGVCVRVDRDRATVLHEPQEVNLWALGMWAAGATDNVEDVWRAWAENRYGPQAAGGVIAALKPTQAVMEEALSVGPFTFGDTRYFAPLGDEEVFSQNWQNWWWDESFVPTRDQAEVGDPAFTNEVAEAKRRALREAERCLMNLELVRGKLAKEDYDILRTRLLTNKVQLEIRSAMILAVLHYRRMVDTDDDGEREAMDQALREDLEKLRAMIRPIYPAPREITHLGRPWRVGPPNDVPREAIYRWAYEMDALRRGEDPREEGRRPHTGRARR